MLFNRGFSPVVLTGLIIILSLASITIVWTAVKPLIESTGTTSTDSCLPVVLRSVNCFANETLSAVVVDRRAGAGDLRGVRFSFTFADGTRAYTYELSHFDQLERRTFGFPYESVPEPLEVDVAPVLADGTVCPLTGSSSFCSGDNAPSQGFACSDGADNDFDTLTDLADPGCESEFDDDESDEPPQQRYQCNDGVDNDDPEDILIDMADPGCLSPTDNNETNPVTLNLDHNFRFAVNASGLLIELNWTSDEGTSWERIVGDRVTFTGSGESFYLHTRTGTGADRSWGYAIGPDWPIPETFTRELLRDITYSKVGQTNNSVTIRAVSSSLQVDDFIWFEGDSMFVNVTITNRLSQGAHIRVPVHLGGLYLHDSSRYRLYGREGGIIERFTDSTSGHVSCSYGASIRCFSPVSVLWDDEKTIGVQYITESYVPTYIDMDERFVEGSDDNEVLKPVIGTWLGAGQTRTFSLVFRVGPSGDWQYTLEPYKEWFYETYGDTPEYCPAPAYGMFFARNSHTGAWSPNPPYNTTTNRFNSGASLEDMYVDRFDTLDDMEQAGLQMFGVWGSTLHASHITRDSLDIGMIPPYFFDPYLDVGPNRSKIGAIAARYNAAGKKLFWYMRECVDLPGASINYGTGEITRSTTNGNEENFFDLRVPSNYERVETYIEEFISEGAQGVYLDAPYCAGVDTLLSNIASEYRDTHYIMAEGGVDRRALLLPQLQITENNGMNDHSHLFLWLVPDATFFEAERDVPNLDLMLSRGFQPVVANGVRELSQAMETPNNVICHRSNSWMRQAYTNQMDRWNSYGRDLGCPEPVEPVNCN